jgi:aryl-alcohol dehydrogenase-like predicted oxidoreductase
MMGRTGVEVGQMALGCMMFGDRTTLDDSCRIVDRAIDAGINLVNTSNPTARAERRNHREKRSSETVSATGQSLLPNTTSVSAKVQT